MLQGFLKFVDEQIAAFEGCVSRGHSPTHCVLYFEALGLQEERTFFHCDQLFRGTYSVYLKQWNRLLGRDSVLVLKSEDYFANSRETLEKVTFSLPTQQIDARFIVGSMDAMQDCNSCTCVMQGIQANQMDVKYANKG